MDVEKIIRLKHLEWTVSRLEFRYIRKKLDASNLYKGDPRLLMVVASEQGRSQGEIAKSLSIKPGTLTVMIQRMESAGLIHRKADAKDMRTLRVYLTGKGKEVAAETYRVFRHSMQEMYEGMSEEDYDHYFEILRKIQNNLSDVRDQDEGERIPWEMRSPHT